MPWSRRFLPQVKITNSWWDWAAWIRKDNEWELEPEGIRRDSYAVQFTHDEFVRSMVDDSTI